MRVAVVLNTLYPPQLEVWRRTRDLGVDVHVVGTLYRPRTHRLPWVPGVPAFVPTHVFAPLGARRRGHLWWMYPGLRQLLDSLKPDVVHVVSEPWGLLVGQCLRAGFPVVAHGADNQYVFGSTVERTIRSRVAKRNLARLAGFASWNQAGIALARRHGLPITRPVACVPAVAPEVAEAPVERESSATRGRRPVIGYVGRLEPQKGVDVLIDAASMLRDCSPLLRIVGEGTASRALRMRAKSRELDAEFVGGVALEDVPETIRSFDVLVVPSRTTPGLVEQFGRVAIEGMAAGVPVVVSDSGALPEVVGEGGVVVREGVPEDLAAALRRVLNADVRYQIACRGRARVSAVHSAEAVGERLVQLWREAVR